jgi:drug/metabolite transporter (DMT)-like permease
MDYVFILAAILLFTVQTLCFNGFSQTFMKNLKSYFLFNFLYFSVVVLIYVALNIHSTGINPITAILAVAFGVLFVATMLFYFNAMKSGPLSYTSLLMSFGLLIPILFGFFLWGEKVSILQGVGLLLLFITFYFVTKSPAASTERMSLRWIVLCISALVCNGGLMTLTKAQQMILPGQEVKEFLILAFGTAATLSLILALFFNRKEEHGIAHLKSRMFVILVLGAGITTAFGNHINLYLSGRIPAVIQFPTVNGGLVLFTSLASVLFFKDKLSSNGIKGLICGIGALILLSIK